MFDIREAYSNGQITLSHVPAASQIADILTKSLGPMKHAEALQMLRLLFLRKFIINRYCVSELQLHLHFRSKDLQLICKAKLYVLNAHSKKGKSMLKIYFIGHKPFHSI